MAKECEWCGEEGCGPVEVTLDCGCSREQCSSDAVSAPGTFCLRCMDAETGKSLRAMEPEPDEDYTLRPGYDAAERRAEGIRAVAL